MTTVEVVKLIGPPRTRWYPYDEETGELWEYQSNGLLHGPVFRLAFDRAQLTKVSVFYYYEGSRRSTSVFYLTEEVRGESPRLETYFPCQR